MSASNEPTFSISSNPLFSTLLSFSALILLNFPRLLWRILLSPAVLLTGFLFLSLLRVGATQKSIQRQTRYRKNRSQIAAEIECEQSVISSAAVLEAVTEGSEVAGSCAFLGATQRSILLPTKNRKNRSQIAAEIECERSVTSYAAVSESVTEGSEVAGSCAFPGATQRSILRQTKNRKNRSEINAEFQCEQSEISSAAVSEAVTEESEGEASCVCLRATQKNSKNRSKTAVEIKCEQSESFAESEVAGSCACHGETQRSFQRQTKNRKNRSLIAVEIDSKLSESSAAVSEVAVSLDETWRSILRQAVEIDTKQSEISSAAVSEAVSEGSCLNATQRSILRQIKNRKNRSQIAVEIESIQSESSTAVSDGSDGGVSSAIFEESFVQWNVRAPLEVIHEEYEKEASNESDEPEPRVERVGLERYPSLSMYYPETDSDSSSDEVRPESMDDNVCFMWDEDEDRDEMIEISLDKMNKKVLGFELELEDNLIEIDISPTRNAGEFSDEYS